MYPNVYQSTGALVITQKEFCPSPLNNGAVPDEELQGAIYLGEDTGWRHLAKTSTWNQVPGTSWRHKTATWNFLPQELLELPAQSVLPGVSPGASCKKLSGVLSWRDYQ